MGTLSFVQSWIRHYKKVQSLSHLPPLHSVFIGLDDGSLLAYHDELPAQPLLSIDPALNNPPLVSLPVISQYKDSTQTSASILALPRGGASQSVNLELEKTMEKSGKGSYELWIGQKGNRITVLDAGSLKVVKFLHNSLDQSVMPSYMAYLSCSHLVYGSTPARGVVSGQGEGKGECVSVFSALWHGQYITRWNADSKKPVDSFNCQSYATSEDKGQSVS